MIHDRKGGDAGGADQGGRRPYFRQRRGCRFCSDNAPAIDYKDARLLGMLISDRGKILPRRLTGVCAKHQRKVTQAIKRARGLAILPFTTVYRPRERSEGRP